MLLRIKCLFTMVSFQLTFSLLLFIIFFVFFFLNESSMDFHTGRFHSDVQSLTLSYKHFIYFISYHHIFILFHHL